MDPFIEQLAALCGTHPTRAKWVFVPTHAIGHTLGERLVREGTNWINLRFVTPLDVALRMGAPFLVERGIDPSEEDLGPALMMRLLLDLPLEGGYFRPLADHPALAHVLWRTVRELRMAGIDAHDLPSAAFESPAKHRELAALLDAYAQHLATHARADMATVYEEAIRHRDWSPIQDVDLWTTTPDVVWTPLQHALFEVLPGARIVPRALDLPGLAMPRRLRDAAVERMPLEPRQHPLACLLDPARADGPQAAIEIFHAGGHEAEIDEVFRRVLASGRPLDDVEIACGIEDSAVLAWEKALRLDWPVTAGTGLPAAQTKPGRALLAFCAWIEGDFPAGVLRRLLQSGNIDPPLGGLTRGQAAALLARAEAGWGRATYENGLQRLARRHAQRASSAELDAASRDSAARQVARLDELRAWISALIAAVPEPGADGLVALSSVVDAVTGFLQACAAVTSALDAVARTAIHDAVRDLTALGAFRCSLPAALRFVRERVEGLVVAPDRPRPGHLHVTSLVDAGRAGRPLTFVIGLEEGRVFPAPVEDPVLLDRERAAIHPALPQSTDRASERVAAVAMRLALCGAAAGTVGEPEPHPRGRGRAAGRTAARSRGSRARQPGLFDELMDDTRADSHESTGNEGPASRPVRAARPAESGTSAAGGAASPLRPGAPPRAAVCLSYSARDTREYRETFPSWLVLQAFRLQTGRHSASYPELRAALGLPRSVVPADASSAASESGWWLSRVVAAGPEAADIVLGAFPFLAAGRAAGAARDSDRLTAFDGYVPEAGALLDPAREDRVVSATQLENAAACPFRHFLERGLGVRALDDGERDPDVWLDPLTRGSELHDLYAALLRRCRAEGRAPGVEADRRWLHQQAEARLAVLQREMPPASGEVFAREREDLLRDLDLFLDGEVDAAQTRTPVGLEVSFGRPLEEEEEELASADPIVVPIGNGMAMRLTGRIDRIDELKSGGGFEVVDYKTGGYWESGWKGVFAGGSRLQHALYGLAVVELLKRSRGRVAVDAGVYYFTSAKGRQERVRIPRPPAANVAAVLADLREVIASGTFVHAPDEDSCTWCDLGAACGTGVYGQTRRKLADPALGAFVRLRSHE